MNPASAPLTTLELWTGLAIFLVWLFLGFWGGLAAGNKMCKDTGWDMFPGLVALVQAIVSLNIIMVGCALSWMLAYG